jgi:hypothetical protein
MVLTERRRWFKLYLKGVDCFYRKEMILCGGRRWFYLKARMVYPYLDTSPTKPTSQKLGIPLGRKLLTNLLNILAVKLLPLHISYNNSNSLAPYKCTIS